MPYSPLPFPQRLIRAIWQRQGIVGKTGWLALLPFSLTFSMLARGRNRLYDWRWLSAHRPELKVISIGNLTVGGSGKTPVVLWLAQALTARGHTVGILTRGYTGKRTGLTVVGTDGRPTATPEEVGDEPVMLARLFAGIVIAGQDRAAAAALARDRFGATVVILDDGFQHRRLSRHVDVLLFNGRQGLENRWVLPAGPFREPLSGVRRAHLILVTKTTTFDNHPPSSLQKQGRAPQCPIYRGAFQPIALVSSEQRQWRELPLTELAGKRVLALTGIADPVPFYQALQDWNVELSEVMEFPDHHLYAQADWQAISLAGQKVDLIVTTEKDLVKLERFPFAIRKLVALRVRMAIEQEELFLADIERRLTSAE
jgi:tetraacyldisaccharide 4'-kinase